VSIQEDLRNAVRFVARDWKKAKRRADREDRVCRRDLERMRQRKTERVSIREAAFKVMEAAYLKASGHGRYFANARQIMYAARPMVLELTGGDIWKSSQYFTQTLLKDFIEDETNEAGNWRVVWDARGHFAEPHTGRRIDIGGIEVEKYITAWNHFRIYETPEFESPPDIKTAGPHFRFGAVLFIEKEGFAPILEAAGIAERFDIAIMSTKGLPVGAACQLAHRFNCEDVRVFVVHDFDLAGFKIVRTLRKGTRLALEAEAIDLGLRLPDVGDLESEPVRYKQAADPRSYLRRCGATKEEREFLVRKKDWNFWTGERVELNAMTSEQFITWLERKLVEHGVTKIVPGPKALARAYRRAMFLRDVDRATEKIRKRIAAKDVVVPDDLGDRVSAILAENPATSWDRAVWKVAAQP
jgi:DNA topoisomerase 6 subunit A-like protein